MTTCDCLLRNLMNRVLKSVRYCGIGISTICICCLSDSYLALNSLSPASLSYESMSDYSSTKTLGAHLMRATGCTIIFADGCNAGNCQGHRRESNSRPLECESSLLAFRPPMSVKRVSCLFPIWNGFSTFAYGQEILVVRPILSEYRHFQSSTSQPMGIVHTVTIRLKHIMSKKKKSNVCMNP